jgi:hypothetical protein
MALFYMTYTTAIVILGVAHLAVEIPNMPGMVSVGGCDIGVTGFAFGQFSVCIPLFYRLSITMEFRSVVAIQAIITVFGQVHVWFCTGGNTQVGMPAPGNVAFYTHLLHIGCLIKIVTIGETTTGDQRANHMTVPACTVANGTFLIVAFNLMGRKLVELVST